MNATLFAQTQQLAVTDGLTGLLLRRPFVERLTGELARAARTREPLSLLMMDVDHFKAYNDQFGHTAGDVVLKGVSDALREAVPPEGVVARYGGEEFAALLPMTPNRQAASVAETIRRQIEQRFQSRPRHATSVTISIGISTYPEDAQEDAECLRVADQRLYQAKRSGRNRVCASRP
jgi:diguanylate cyclase (GGDEF)-like protein